MSFHTQAFRTKTNISVKKAGIIIKEDDLPASSMAEILYERLEEKGIKICSNRIDPDCDIIIILGGDGTLLRVASQAAHHSIPVIGINMGNLGFLTELAEDEAIHALEKIIKGSVTVERRMMLKASLEEDGRKRNKSYYALNEVVISKGALDQILELSTKADEEFITTYKADGLIFSTPTGSTAYNLSAGGPLVYPGLASILVTPICPFMLGSRPILLSSETKLSTTFRSTGYNAEVIVDGQPAEKMSKKTKLIIETAEHPLLLLTSPHRDYFDILRTKLHWGYRQETK